MFHPLLPDLTALKDTDIEAKMSDLNKKYAFAARTGDGGLCSQLLLVIESYRLEQGRRLMERATVSVNKQDKDLDSLINVS